MEGVHFQRCAQGSACASSGRDRTGGAIASLTSSTDQGQIQMPFRFEYWSVLFRRIKFDNDDKFQFSALAADTMGRLTSSVSTSTVKLAGNLHAHTRQAKLGT